MKVSIIIPVYNEEQTIAKLIEKVKKASLPNGVSREIIIVNDGSTDQSKKIIKNEYLKDKSLKIYQMRINLGKGAAVRTGISLARGEIILIQDADLELNPEEYSKLINPILANKTKVVFGSRFLSKNFHIPMRTILGNKLLTLFTNFLYGSSLTDMETAYKAARSEVFNGLGLRCVGFDFEPEVTARILQMGHRILEVPISYNPRRKDEGKKISAKDGLDAVSTLIKVKLFPIRH